jgi:hypothetical protein
MYRSAAGCALDERNLSGQSALDLARMQGLDETVAIIETAMAQ